MSEGAHKTTKKGEGLLAILAFLGSVSLLLVGLERSGVLDTHSELAYGRQLDECVFESGGESLHLKRGRWYFFAVSSLEYDGSLLNYLARLKSSPYLSTGNLEPIILIDGAGEQESIRSFIRENGINYSVLALHGISGNALADLGISDHRRRYFLLDPDLRVVFHAEFMKPKDLRQLLEKHFGTSSPGITAVRQIIPGSSLALQSLTSIREGQSEFDARSALLVVFTSACVSCSLDNTLQDVGLHQETVKAIADMNELDVYLLFSPAFVARDVRQRLEEVGIEIPGFIAGDLPGIEDAYLRRSLHGWDVVAIETDENLRVARIQSWQSLLEAYRGAEDGGEI